MKIEERLRDAIIQSDIMEIISTKKLLDDKIKTLSKDLQILNDFNVSKEDVEGVIDSLDIQSYTHPDDLYNDIISELDCKEKGNDR